jgi:hypothetical protein
MVAPHHSLTRHSLIPVKHTIHASHLIFCLYSYFSFSLVYRSGAFGWIDAAQVSKMNLSHTYPASSQTASSCAVDIVIIVLCRFFALRIAVYSYIYCSFGRLSIELYSPYMIMINRYTPCWSLQLDNHGPVKIGHNGGGPVLRSFPHFQAHGAQMAVSMNYHGWRGGQTPSRILSEYGSYRSVTSQAGFLDIPISRI